MQASADQMLTTHPTVWIWFEGDHIRKWSREPFPEGQPYSRGLPTADSPQEQWNIAHRDGAYNERSEIETHFWSIVDRDGLSGLPSDMWAALESLMTRWHDPVAATQREMAFVAGKEFAANAVAAHLDGGGHDSSEAIQDILAEIARLSPLSPLGGM